MIQRAFPTIRLLTVLYFTFLLLSLGDFGAAKEVEVTDEWTLLGETDTIPAGMHVRMDMTTGQKWVKTIDESEEDNQAHMAAAVIQEDGSVTVEDEPKIEEAKEEVKSYDYDMMHRTLSQLPDEEKERFGGLPNLPTGDSKTPLTSKEREAFQKRMEEIWKKRQEELKELEESVLDMPEVLKERIKSIKSYLSDPVTELKKFKLGDDTNDSDGMATDIITVLQDLEFQLTDVDMARDFHTLGGWQLLVSLLSEDVHVPQNKTVSTLSRSTEAKVRSVQAQAAWAIGTAVKNTGEFFPFATEKLNMGDGTKTTAIDLLIDLFCKDYKDANSWEIRTMLAKGIYGIGALLRGNRVSQAHVCENGSSARLGEKFRQLSLGSYTSSNIKLMQRMMALAGDIVSDVQLHGEMGSVTLNNEVIDSFTSADWCGAVSNVLLSDSFLPVQVQEKLLQSVEILAYYCSWDERSEEFVKSIETIKKGWQDDKGDFDPEHYEQLLEMAAKALETFEKSAGQ